MSIPLIASLATLLLVIASDITYVRGIFLGQTKPSRSSYWVWTLVQAMTVVSFGFSGGSLGVTLNAAYAFGFLLYAFLSLKYGEGTWGRIDTICLSLALVAGLAWYLTRSSEIAVYILLAADVIGAIPTLIKSWHRPENEDLWAWILSTVASFTNIFAITGFDFASWDLVFFFHALTYIAINGLIAAAIWLRLRA